MKVVVRPQAQESKGRELRFGRDWESRSRVNTPSSYDDVGWIVNVVSRNSSDVQAYNLNNLSSFRFLEACA